MNDQQDQTAIDVKKRIVAVFQPQAYINNHATDIDGQQDVDVTEQVLRLSLDSVLALQDYRDSTENLVDAEKLGHDGPFTVRVVASVCDYFGVNELRDISADRFAAAQQGIQATSPATAASSLTDDELADKALADYNAVTGKVIEVEKISGYDEHDNSHDLLLAPAAKVRVLTTDRASIVRWCDDWMDPCWDVELAEPHPQVKNLRSLWVYGPSYHPDGRVEAGDQAVGQAVA
ncbi:hypothetical protein [Paraburkholderia sp. SIMBA_054]|uniref:hypothetical protein n=1 Tax=Paraburkholderia sp. SIMBA_054 TaxID=3085795 RepID=UPI00397AD3D5